MANYDLVINSSFKPFSYQDFLAPVLAATQAHQDLENQYEELAAKANIWDEMANEETDPYAYKMYKTYANDLESQANQLAREGLNAASRRNMLHMKSRYSKEITPIEQAYATRQKQAEQQQQALLQDPTLMLSRRAATTSLDDYIRNPQLAYDSYSGKLITAQTSQAAGALAKEMQNNPRKWRSILGNSYYETMMQKGFSSQAVLQAIQDNPSAAPQLTKIVEDAVNSSGVKNWGDQTTIARAIDYAKQGLWSAVGETQYQTLDNWRAKIAAEAAAKAQQADIPELDYKPRTLNHLETSGDLAAMKAARDTIMVNGKGLKASLFGRRGQINPMQVYEYYTKALENAIKHNISESSEASSNGPKKSAKEIAMQAVEKKYGKVRVLTSSQYDALKKVGYTNRSAFKDFKKIDENINNSVTAYTENFINGVDMDYMIGVIGRNIKAVNAADKSFANMVTPLDKNFNLTSDKFDGDAYNEEKNPIVDISHSIKHSNKLIATFKDGSKVALNPDIVSGEASGIMKRYQARKSELIGQGHTKREVENYLEPYLMQEFTKLALRGYNQSLPKTDSKLE